MNKISSDTRIIFLDIDGVLNSNNFYVNFYEKHEKKDLCNDIDPRAVEILNRLCEEIKAKVVISSCWRIGSTTEEMQKAFNDLGCTFEIIGVTPIINFSMCRGLEVQEWISRNIDYKNFPYDNYVIIDDDSDFFIHQEKHFFNTDNFVGLTPTICYQIKRFFKVE